jgi:prevent-host-death family protein
MRASPDIVPVSLLREDIAGAIARANEDGRPVFITQGGRLTAVLLSRRRYDELFELLAESADDTSRVGRSRRRPERTDWPVRGFPPSRPRTRVDTLYGLVDPETAAFHAQEGLWTEDDGSPPPPYPWQRDSALDECAGEEDTGDADDYDFH